MAKILDFLRSNKVPDFTIWYKSGPTEATSGISVVDSGALSPFYVSKPLADRENSQPGESATRFYQGLASSSVRLALNGTNLGLFKISSFSIFWLAEPIL